MSNIEDYKHEITGEYYALVASKKDEVGNRIRCSFDISFASAEQAIAYFEQNLPPVTGFGGSVFGETSGEWVCRIRY